MALGKGPEELICSYRGCTKPAVYALTWSNPAIHFGREKHWLSCAQHLEELQRYFKYRDFPCQTRSLEDFLQDQGDDPGQSKRTGVPT